MSLKRDFYIKDGAIKRYKGTETDIVIPNGITSIEGYAFPENLKSITIPKSVTSIEVSAFDGCTSLENVILPDSLEHIHMWAFYECYNLNCVTVSEDSKLDVNSFVEAFDKPVKIKRV